MFDKLVNSIPNKLTRIIIGITFCSIPMIGLIIAVIIKYGSGVVSALAFGFLFAVAVCIFTVIGGYFVASAIVD